MTVQTANGKQGRSINCPGKGCPICEIRKQQKANKEPYTYAMGRRFSMNIINQETGKLEIMEQGIGFFEDLRDLRTDLKEQNLNLIDVDIKVRRRGTGKDDTSYRLDIADKKELTSEQIELTENKTNLQEYFKENTNEQILRLINGENWEDVMNYQNEEEENEEDVEIK